MKIKWQNHFYFTKTERNGIFILACLCVLGFLTPKLFSLLQLKDHTDFAGFQQEVEVFENSLTPLTEIEAIAKTNTSNIKLFTFDPNMASKEEFIQLGLSPSVAQTILNYRNSGAIFFKKEDFKKVYGLKEADYIRLASYIEFPKQKPSYVEKTPKAYSIPIKKVLSLFPFNPNTATKEELLALGLSRKITQTILNYRAKGGSFREKSELKRIYGLTQEDYQVLAPFINIPRQLSNQQITTRTKIPKDIPQTFDQPIAIKIDINQATIEDWQKLKGVGAGYAKRIVNFRDKLGGFVAIGQISTTYGVPDSVIQNIKTQLIISPIANKISINTIPPELLKNHPYVKTKQAYIIVNYRVNHGNFQNIADLKKIRALTPEFIDRIEPYLSFE